MNSGKLLLRSFLLFILLLLWKFPVCSQSYHFNNYQVENGLSNNTILSILQDRRGFMWFGTKDGLNRFDGYSFKVFRRDVKSAGSLGNNFVYTLVEDANGNLWVGTEEGLYKYEHEYETFTLIASTKKLNVHELNCDKDGNLWFITGFSTCKYSIRANKLEIFDYLKYFHVTGIGITADGNVWFSTADGKIKKYNSANNSFVSFDLFPASYSGDRWLGPILVVDSRYLFASRPVSELKIFDVKSLTSRTVKIPVNNPKNPYLRAILQVSKDEFWIASEFGVFTYNRKTGEFRNLKKSYDEHSSLSDNAVHGLYKDRESGVWVGTYFGGVNYYPRQFSPFFTYTPKVKENSIGGNIIRQLSQDKYGNIWVGTEDAGISKLEAKTGRFKHFVTSDSRDAISYNNVHGLLSSGNELWIGTFHNGLDVMDIRSGKVIRKYKAGAKSGFISNFIYCLYETSEGEKLAGTSFGIFKYKRDADRFEPLRGFPSTLWYSSIIKDSRGIIYAGTFGNGVFSYDAKNKVSRHFNSVPIDSTTLPHSWVNFCFEDSRHNVWFGTNEGLCKLNSSNMRMIRYGTKNGFPSDYMLSILEDKQNFLWISTTKGLVRFDQKTSRAEVYTKANGLLTDQFNYTSSLKTVDGRLYFGSLKGLISFNPEEFRNNTYIPPLYITKLEVNNKEVQIGKNSKILQKSTIFSDSIILHYYESTFNLEFSALGYTNPQAQKYAFKLEGLSKRWTHLDKNRKVYFTQIPPGNYTLKIKVCNSGGYWGPEETKLYINILPPWWQSKPAYVGYLITFILIVVLAVRIYHRQMKVTNRRKMEMVQLAKEKEVVEAKIDFFTNVAHEIRTPLTLIKIPLRKVIRETVNIPEVANSLKMISNNTERLIQLTNQLLDFRQVEMSEFRLDLKKCNISQLLAKAFENFSSLAESNNLEFTLKLAPSVVYAFVDVDALEKIFFNLLSNAVKYAETYVEVSLERQSTPQASFIVKIKNDGAVIPEELKDKIFEPFFRVKHTETVGGTGIGLPLARSLTELLGGKVVYSNEQNTLNLFSLTLPVNNDKTIL